MIETYLVTFVKALKVKSRMGDGTGGTGQHRLGVRQKGSGVLRRFGVFVRVPGASSVEESEPARRGNPRRLAMLASRF